LIFYRSTWLDFNLIKIGQNRVVYGENLLNSFKEANKPMSPAASYNQESVSMRMVLQGKKEPGPFLHDCTKNNPPHPHFQLRILHFTTICEDEVKWSGFGMSSAKV
jgi:hypothetical protein